jgi:hypothetical protein
MSINELCNTNKHSWRGHMNKGRVWIQLELWIDFAILHIDEDDEQDGLWGGI